MLKIYIDRQKIAENNPAIVVESQDGTVQFCSEVRSPEFAIKQDFSRDVKPVVWIEYYDGPLRTITSKPANAAKVDSKGRKI
jgi:hypothetical protein